jgi:hypothetical protein
MCMSMIAAVVQRDHGAFSAVTGTAEAKDTLLTGLLKARSLRYSLPLLCLLHWGDLCCVSTLPTPLPPSPPLSLAGV